MLRIFLEKRGFGSINLFIVLYFSLVDSLIRLYRSLAFFFVHRQVTEWLVLSNLLLKLQLFFLIPLTLLLSWWNRLFRRLLWLGLLLVFVQINVDYRSSLLALFYVFHLI
jgi:hypothetical protein